MPWQIPLALNVVITYIGNPIVTKKSVGLPGRTMRLVLMFTVNAILSWLLFVLMPDGGSWTTPALLTFGVGVLNSFACYAHWRAADVSLSRTSMLAQGDDIIALALGYAVLGETSVLTPVLVIGVVLAMGSAIALSLRKREDDKAPPRTFLGWVALYCVLWGIAVFSLRAFGLSGVSVPRFLVGWYSGSFIGSLGVAAIMGKKERTGGLDRRGIFWALAICSMTVTGLGFSYWAKCLAPITVVQPILQVSEAILPTLIGLYVFKESKGVDSTQRMLYATGIAGSLVLILNY